MSTNEAERYRLLKKHQEGAVSLLQISELLNLNYRHVKRLWQCFQKDGAKGLISKKRGKTNNHLSISLENQVLEHIRAHYCDYGPTLACEKLNEVHQITISKEAVRKLMIRDGLWKPERQKKIKVYQRRKRRNCLGELIQMDGSPHAWFEDRGSYCTLIHTVDDATGRILAARFETSETTDGYFRLMKSYLNVHGKPICLYTDKYGVFRVNHGNDRSQPTQFARAMKELGVEMIAANSPQAKGRIERANGVLQDRLVKELREKNISTIEQANLFLPTYLETYNKRFGKIPASPFNAHRTLDHNQDLDKILCNKELRKISKNLEVNYKNKIYQIQAPTRINRLRGVSVQIIEKMNGEILIEYNGALLDFIKYEESEAQPKVVDHKELIDQWEKSSKRVHKPSSSPWRSGKSVNF